MALIFIGVIVVFLLASFYVASRICRMLKKRPSRARVAVWVTVLALDVSCSVGRRHDSDLVLLWLWCRSAATAPIRPLAWEPPYAEGVALKKQNKTKK